MNLKQKIIDLFCKIAKIPHVSGHTEKLISYLSSFAGEHGFVTQRNGGNLIITIPASEGLEDKPAIIVQGHCDMVGVSDMGVRFNFLDDSLNLEIVNDEFLTAKGTTLGADDGIALVYMMLLMEAASDPDSNFKHAKIYCLITSDEEIGLLGAKALDYSLFEDVACLINLDGGREGYFIVSSSGGEEITGTYTYETSPAQGRIYEVSVSGLNGGHSGGNTLNQYGPQAAKVLSQILSNVYLKHPFQLISFDCSEPNNAITDQGKARFISDAPYKEVRNSINRILSDLDFYYVFSDPGIYLSYSNPRKKTEVQKAFTTESSEKILFNILFAPYGVQKISNGENRASINLGSCIADAESGTLTIKTHLRFAGDIDYILNKDKISDFFSLSGADIKEDNYDPPWIKKENHLLLYKAEKIYEEFYGTKPNLVRVHATLEPGVFRENLPDIDIISIGPDMENIHTPKERLDLNSAVRVYEFLIELITRIS